MKNINISQIVAEVANAAATQAIDYELENVNVLWDFTPSSGNRKTVMQVEFAENMVGLVRVEDANGLIEWTRSGTENRYSEPKQLLSEALAA